jgi:peptide/nickel transport system ATP-binding protein
MWGDAVDASTIPTGGTAPAAPAPQQQRGPSTVTRGERVRATDGSGDAPYLEVTNLTVAFPTADGVVRAVQDLTYNLRLGQTLAVVGESGSGKSVSSMAIMGLHDPKSTRMRGSIRLGGREIVGMPQDELRHQRGRAAAMIFQDPQSSLHPFFTIGKQITEAYQTHHKVSAKAARKRAIDMLGLVGIPNAARRLDDYPHQFSGGMRQRVMIAMALVNDPKLLIADEPTTALDVTVQAQILDLIRDLQRDFGSAVLFVTHDLGVVAEIADDVAVMYAGQIVEQATVDELFARPRHPYTAALIAALPQSATPGDRLATIPGQVPDPADWPGGCHFADRCAHAEARCREAPVELRPVGDALARCVRTEDLHLTGGPA